MAAIVSGSSLDLLNSSLYVLGSQGARDELLIGRGPELGLLRTYNSQGLLNTAEDSGWSGI
jgi:hypothetical protein